MQEKKGKKGVYEKTKGKVEEDDFKTEQKVRR